MVAIFAIGVRIWPALEPVRTPAGVRDEIHITEGLDVWLEPAASDDLRALSMVIDYVDRRTGDGEPVFAFPAVGAVLFGAGVSNPTNHDYWYAGFPDRSVEAETLQRLRVLDPRYIVTLNDGWAWFMESPPYFTEMHEYAVKNYSLEARFGRYDVLGRKGEFSADEQVFWQAPGGRRDILQRVNGRRRQAVRRWMEGLTPAEAREAVLPARPSDILLLLRALRDGGDLRTLGWLTQGMAHPDTRIWQEALFATELVVSRFYASTNRWANDLDVTGYFAYLEPHVGAAIDALSHRTEQRVLERREEGARELLRRALAAVSAP
jgi:hypothetical protein